MSEFVVGLDIGTTKIACIVGRKNEQGKIEILGMGRSESIGVNRGIVSNIQQTVDSINAAVEEASNISGVEIHSVNVGVAGQHIKSLQHRGMRMRDSNLGEIDQFDLDCLIKDAGMLALPPGEEIIDVLPQEYVIDNETGIKEPIGHAGTKIEADFHIITGHVNAIRNIHRCVGKADLVATDLMLEPLASAASVLSEEEKEAGIVLVDIGGGTTDIAIFHDGIIRHTAVIPFGGNIITNDIKTGCTIMKKHAEQLKVKFGTAMPMEKQDNEIVCIPGLSGRPAKEISVKNLSSIINARMSEIIDFVHYEIKNSGFEKQLIGGIVVTGGGSQLKHLPQLFSYKTGMDTRIGYPNEHLGSVNSEEITSPMYSTGVGLVIKGFERLEKLSEPEKKKRKKGKPVGGLFSRILQGAEEFMSEKHD